MKDLIVVLIIILILVFAIVSVIKKKKSKASCCGSGAYIAKSKKLKSVACKKTYKVDGMHCQNCVNRVMEAVQDLGGTSASVNLNKGILTVSMQEEIDDFVIIDAVKKHGYEISVL